MNDSANNTVFYHLPGLFEAFGFYRVFLPLFRGHREYFHSWCEIGSIYGAPGGCLWGGGRLGGGDCTATEALALTRHYGISARLTFSNSLLREEHLRDRRCNELCAQFSRGGAVRNGVIVHSDTLLGYLRRRYPELYFVSSTTKVLTDFALFQAELGREEFSYVVPDFRLNWSLGRLLGLSSAEKSKVEFLCNECCWYGCKARKACYETVSRQNLGEDCPDFRCVAPGGSDGYRFSRAMENPGFIGVEAIRGVYQPGGFSNFKIEGRGLGSAMLLEFLLHYMTKPECQLKVREEMYLDSSLDLF